MMNLSQNNNGLHPSDDDSDDDPIDDHDCSSSSQPDIETNEENEDRVEDEEDAQPVGGGQEVAHGQGVDNEVVDAGEEIVQPGEEVYDDESDASFEQPLHMVMPGDGAANELIQPMLAQEDLFHELGNNYAAEGGNNNAAEANDNNAQVINNGAAQPAVMMNHG